MATIPIKPVEPQLEDCCRSGCVPCVFDLYEEALARYEAWLAEQDKTGAPPDGPAITAQTAPHG